MSDTLPESSIIESCLKLLYSERVAKSAAGLFRTEGEQFKVYIVGCLLLTLTASVQPLYTLLEKRRCTMQPQFPDQEAVQLAEAGLYRDGSRLVCFHCSAKVSVHAEGLSNPGGGLRAHRAASPNCYFVRFLDFVESRGTDPSLTESVARDVGRYAKALRKLKADLDCNALRFAASFGYSEHALAFFATRHFMRNSGRLPDRAGDIIGLLHSYEAQFDPSIPQTVDVLGLLAPLKLLSSGGGAESGYHSVVIGRYDQQSGAWQSSTQSLTSEQLRQLQAVLGQLPGSSSGSGSSSLPPPT